jgi:TolA-binding protein
MRRGTIITVAFLVILSAIFASCQKGPKQEELFERAKKLQEQSSYKEAIAAYQDFVKRFPKSQEAPQCQFMVGYLYANHMNNNDMARKAYEDFIQKFPENELVKDAQWELDHLGMDVNQIEELNKIIGSPADTSKVATGTSTKKAQ